MAPCFVYKVIRDLESIDHLYINPNTQVIYRVNCTSECFTEQLLTQYYVTVTLGWHDSGISSLFCVVVLCVLFSFAIISHGSAVAQW